MSSQLISLKADEAISWFQKRLKNAINYGLSSEDSKLFDIFITSTLSDVDIKKQIINTVLPSFFENIVSRKVNKPTIDAQVSIIRFFMKYYGGTCGQFKNTLDKFTYKAISDCFNDDNIMLKVTKYLALYPQCGGRGQQGINHAEAWTSQFDDYLYSTNYFLNELYTNVNFFSGNNIEIEYKGKFDISVFNLSVLGQSTPKERYEKLTSIFIFFNTAIQSMLLSIFSTTKHFNSNKVIQLAQSTLSVTSEKLNATMITEDVIALDSVLWKLHCSVIKTISALIKCCSRNLIPQGTSICRILIQSLNMAYFSSPNSVYGTTRPKQQQRILTYQVIRSWLAVAGSQSSLEICSENLTSGILLDIKYDKPSLNLIVDKPTGNRKRKSGALNEKIINQRDTIVMHDYHANETVCNEALKTLNLVLDTMSLNLKPLQFKIFQSTIMGLLLEITKFQRPYEYPLPYYDNLCRLNLYMSLLALVTSPHPQCIPHTSTALRIFTLGTSDCNERIKEVCRSSLSKLEHIIRPRNDTLFFPLENEENNKVDIPDESNYINKILTHDLKFQKEFLVSDINLCNDNHIPICKENIPVVQPIGKITKSNLDSSPILASPDKTLTLEAHESVKEISRNDVDSSPIVASPDNTLTLEALESGKEITKNDVDSSPVLASPDKTLTLEAHESVKEITRNDVDSLPIPNLKKKTLTPEELKSVEEMLLDFHY